MTHFFSHPKKDNSALNIHLIVAMQAEATPIIKKLKLEKIVTHQYPGIDIYHGEVGEKNLHLFVNQKDNGMDKIGTVHAALLTYKAIQFLKPDLILNVGTSGGIHTKSVKIFDIICAKDFVIYHDRFSGDDEGSIKQSLGFLPVSSCDDNMSSREDKMSFRKDNVSFRGLTAESTLKQGIIASSNSLIVHPKNWEIIKKYNVLCVDMEAAGVAEVAHEFSIPFAAFKVVTDYVYETNPIDTLPQFMQNFSKAMDLLSEFLFRRILTTVD